MPLTYDTVEEANQVSEDETRAGNPNYVAPERVSGRRTGRYQVIYTQRRANSTPPGQPMTASERREMESRLDEIINPPITKEEYQEGIREKEQYEAKREKAKRKKQELAEKKAKAHKEELELIIADYKAGGYPENAIPKIVEVRDPKTYELIDYELSGKGFVDKSAINLTKAINTGKPIKETKSFANSLLTRTSRQLEERRESQSSQPKNVITSLPSRMPGAMGESGESRIVKEPTAPEIASQSPGFEDNNVGEKLKWQPNVEKIQP